MPELTCPATDAAVLPSQRTARAWSLEPSLRTKCIGYLAADAVRQVGESYVSASHGRHDESLHPRSGEPDVPPTLDSGGDATGDAAKAPVVEPVQIDVALAKFRYGSTAVRVVPGLTISRKVLFCDPDHIQSVDAVSGRRQGQRNTFHLVLRAASAPPERKRVPAGAQIRGHRVRGNFPRGQLGTLQPLGSGDLASQKQPLPPQILGHFPDVLAKPWHGLTMSMQHVDQVRIAPRFGRLHRGVAEFHIGVRERSAYHC